MRDRSDPQGPEQAHGIQNVPGMFQQSRLQRGSYWTCLQRIAVVRVSKGIPLAEFTNGSSLKVDGASMIGASCGVGPAPRLG